MAAVNQPGALVLTLAPCLLALCRESLRLMQYGPFQSHVTELIPAIDEADGVTDE
ncbi:MAG: hypothetical protein U0Z53_28905 [Blastocatellia bacterium]